MIRFAEMVLPGHPDKFCDQVADAIVAACYAVDSEAYCQVEVSCWGDEVWLTGGIVTRQPLAMTLPDIVRTVGHAIGYVPGNVIDAVRYRVTDVVCQHRADPREWTHHVNDQCIAVGWAGYDAKVAWLPPEHFLAHVFREALTASMADGRLAGHGPDGKLLVRLREGTTEWVLEQVLVTVQHREQMPLVEVCGAVAAELEARYAGLRTRDSRWAAPWEAVEVFINPNGPLINGGSDGDNGQTGRKLAMDYYGARVGQGGGALSGKDLAHIDRAAAYALRQAAVSAVAAGAPECKVTGAWAPNCVAPLEIIWEMDGRPPALPEGWCEHEAMRRRHDVRVVSRDIARGRHFFDLALPWNVPCPESRVCSPEGMNRPGFSGDRLV